MHILSLLVVREVIVEWRLLHPLYAWDLPALKFTTTEGMEGKFGAVVTITSCTGRTTVIDSNTGPLLHSRNSQAYESQFLEILLTKIFICYIVA